VHTKPQSAPRAKWDPSHPALERYGWDKAPDPNACDVEFWNDCGEALEVFWLSPAGEPHKVAGIAPGMRTLQNSFIGHKFFVQKKKKKSDAIVCRKGSRNIYRIGNDLLITAGSNEL
jgi:hypothetical protein